MHSSEPIVSADIINTKTYQIISRDLLFVAAIGSSNRYFAFASHITKEKQYSHDLWGITCHCLLDEFLGDSIDSCHSVTIIGYKFLLVLK